MGASPAALAFACELFEGLGESAFHPTVGAAVDAYLADSGVDWEP